MKLKTVIQENIFSQEAQALISQRKFDARAVFEKNTCAGQLHNRRSSAAPTSGETVTLNRKASLPSWPPKSENGMQSLIENVPSPGKFYLYSLFILY